jgi:hypothetical protein
MPALDRASLLIEVYGTNRQLISPAGGLLITLRDGYQKQLHCEFHKSAKVLFEVPFRNNFADAFTVIAWGESFLQAGCHPIQVAPAKNDPAPVQLMLLPAQCSYDFGKASSPSLDWLVPKTFAPAVYAELVQQAQVNDDTDALATLLNIVAAAPSVQLATGRDPVSYFDRLWTNNTPTRANWPEGLKHDRFYVWVNGELKKLLEADKVNFEEAPKADHHLPGQDDVTPAFSRKHRLRQSANIQFTFYDVQDDAGNVVLELDIDYHKDKAAHILLEGLPHMLAKLKLPFLEKRTDPKIVHVLRWIEEKRAGSDFQPLYSIV